MSEKETPSSVQPDAQGGTGKKAVPHWKQGEEHVLPKNNLPVVFTGLMACVFLAALDQVCSFQPWIECQDAHVSGTPL